MDPWIIRIRTLVPTEVRLKIDDNMTNIHMQYKINGIHFETPYFKYNLIILTKINNFPYVLSDSK